MLDNQTRRELLSKARQSGFPGSILDVFTAYEQGKDLIGEFQQQQQQQQGQQMSDMAAQQSGMMPPGQQPLPQEMPQAPTGPPPGLQGQSLPSPPPPSNPNLVDSTQQQPVGMSTNAKGSAGGQVLMATGGFVEKFTDDQYNKFSSHFPFSKEQRGSIAHRATVEHPDLTMVNPKKYVFGGLKYALGGKEDPPEMPFGLPLKEQNIYTLPEYNQPKNPKTGEILPDPQRPSLGMGTGATEYKMTAGFEDGDVDIPTIVAGQYIGQRGAEDRYRLTGERFKTMADPGAYSKFYEQTGRLGLMQEKRKGGFKFETGGLEGDPLKKGNIATAADSSYVAAGADAPHNFYKKAGYTVVPADLSKDIRPSEMFQALANEREFMYNDRNSRSRSANYSDYTNYKPGQHRFEQRELTTGNINLKAPRSKYDDRILPQGIVTYAGTGKNGDVAEVPKYDKLAVTPWKDLSDAEKLKRLQKYGGSGTPYKDKASIKQGIEDLKNPMPQPKMKEPGLLPVPKIDLQLQLQNTQSPYQPVDRGEYFIKPSGNPGVGVIHYKKDNGDGTYTTKVIGPSLARDWYNDADQKIFDDKDPNTRVGGRVDYDPRDPDQKIYRDMHDAVMGLEKNTSSVQDSAQERLRLRKENEAKQGAIKFATGGKKLLKKRK